MPAQNNFLAQSVGAFFAQVGWGMGLAEKVVSLAVTSLAFGRWTLTSVGVLSPIKSDKLFEYEAVLMQVWHVLPEERRQILASKAFAMRRGQTTSSDLSFFEQILLFPKVYKPVLGLPSSQTIDTTVLAQVLERAEDTLIGFEPKEKEALIELAMNRARSTEKIARTFYGGPGTGKTEAATNYLPTILQLPSCKISLSGLTVADLEGRNGRIGSIAECFLAAKCINPVITFDDADRVMNQERKGGSNDFVAFFLGILDGTKAFRDHHLGLDVNITAATFLYTTNRKLVEDVNGKMQPIEAFYDRAPEIEFTGFPLEYRLAYLNGTYIPEIVANNTHLGLTHGDFEPYLLEWKGEQERQEQGQSPYKRDLRVPKLHFEGVVDRIVMKKIRQQIVSVAAVTTDDKREDDAVKDDSANGVHAEL